MPKTKILQLIARGRLAMSIMYDRMSGLIFHRGPFLSKNVQDIFLNLYATVSDQNTSIVNPEVRKFTKPP